MPPKNKACKNAFFYYMQEVKAKQPQRFQNMQEVAEAAGEYWQKMTKDEKRPYEIKAKSNKQGDKTIKYTSTGKNIELVQKEQKEMVINEQLMQDNIKDSIHLAIESGTLSDKMFYVIHINYFCYCNTDKRYYPAEIGIAKFNLRSGVVQDNVFNMICQPGSLPLGYSSLAKQVSENSHQIPPPMTSETEYNLDEVAYSLWTFMKTNSIDNRFPPVYAAKKNQPIVENVLANFSADFGYPELKTYSLVYLFYVLRNNCSEEKTWVASSLSELELEKDKYEFCAEIPCTFHINSDAPNHCSRSHVVRTVYTICDNCCADLGIDLIPGQHVPNKANTAISRPYSRATTCASSSAPNSEYHYPSKAIDGYLSRQESDYSVASETSTVIDVNDYGAVGGFDSEFSQAESEAWFPVLPKNKKSSNSQDSAKHPLRRPNTLSAALTGAHSAGKGRGKGVAANFYGNK